MSSGPSEPRAKRRIRLIAPIVLMTIMALAAGMASTVWATFTPSADIEIGSHDGNNESSVNASVTSFYNIPAKDQNFDAIVTFTPPEWFVAAGADIPLGATVGILATNTTLGLVFTPCNIPLGVNIDFANVTGETPGMLNATPDRSDTFTSTGNIGLGPNSVSPAKWNGFDIMPSGNYRAVDHYPSFVATMYSAEPRARYFGVSYIGPLATWVVVQFLVFEPGTNIAAGIPSDPDWGYGSLTVVNNPTVTDPSSSAGDFCTSATNPGFASENTAFGETEAGDTLRTNPQYGGTYTFHSWSRGRADDDGDGFENYMDTCPYTVDPPSEDPRTTRGPDGDSIMSSCDPAPGVPCWPGSPGQNDNCDNDKFANTADNCPQIANDAQETGGDADMDNIGDACDDGATVTRPTKAIAIDIEIDGPAPSTATATPTPTPSGSVTATPTPSGTETATPTATPPPGPEGICGFSFPGTYNGFARLNGVPANGYVVTAEVGGEPWGSAVIQNGRYALDVPDHPPATPPCFPPESGTALVFKIDGATCTTTPATTTWQAGLHDVDLACAPAATATPTTPPSTQPPAGTPAPGTPKATATPAKPPSTGGGGLGGDGDLPVWAIVLAGWAGLTALAGLGTLATRIAKR
jgi:hypothetical protein